jgi:hypothetical protein
VVLPFFPASLNPQAFGTWRFQGCVILIIGSRPVMQKQDRVPMPTPAGILPGCSQIVVVRNLLRFERDIFCGRTCRREDEDAAMAEWPRVSRPEAHVHQGHERGQRSIGSIYPQAEQLHWKPHGELSTVTVMPAA